MDHGYSRGSMRCPRWHVSLKLLFVSSMSAGSIPLIAIRAGIERVR